MRIEFKKVQRRRSRAIAVKKPSITGVTRLETQPTAIGMLAGLQAPLADPLWMLSRQWQFNEFQGEDAGTPLRVRFSVHGSRVDAFRAGPRAGRALADDRRARQCRSRRVWRPNPRGRRIRVCAAKRGCMRCAWRDASCARRCSRPIRCARDADRSRGGPAGLLWSTLLRSAHGRCALHGDRLASARLTARRRADGFAGGLALGGADVDAAKTCSRRWLAWLDACSTKATPPPFVVAAEPDGIRLRVEGRRHAARGRRVHRRPCRLGRLPRARAAGERRGTGAADIRGRDATSLPGHAIRACRRSATGSSRTATSTSPVPRRASPICCA